MTTCLRGKKKICNFAAYYFARIMKTRRNIVLLLALCMLVPNAGAVLRRSGGKTWSSFMDNRGLYGRGLGQSPHTLSIVFAPNFYSGDVELPGNLLTGHKDHAASNLYTPFGTNNGFMNSVGFAGALQYTYRHTKYIAYRVQVMGGTLKGHTEFTRPHENSAKMHYHNLFIRDFRSVFFEYGAGVEIYPAPNAGFFLYIGAAATTSMITRNYESWSSEKRKAAYDVPTSKSAYTKSFSLPADEQKIVCTVPTIPVGLGYKWNIKSLQVGVELMWHPAVVDMHKMNLDGWISGHVDEKGYDRYPNEKSTNRWADSFFELGISVGYRIPTR